MCIGTGSDYHIYHVDLSIIEYMIESKSWSRQLQVSNI